MSQPIRSAAREAQPAPSDTSGETHASLALGALFQELVYDRPYRILDLGAARGPNVEILSGFCSRIQIEDLYASLGEVGLIGDACADATPSWPDRIVAYSEGRPFDIILAWDLMDYLGRPGIDALMERLRRCSATGAYLFALTWTRKEIPAEPIHFRLVDRQTLVYESPTSKTRRGPIFTPRDFAAMAGGFRVHHSFLLKHGVQEYLFVRE